MNYLKKKHEQKKFSHEFFPNFKLKEEVLNAMIVAIIWSLPKTDLETNFLNLENGSFFSMGTTRVNFLHSFS